VHARPTSRWWPATQAGAARWQAAPLDSLRQYVRENCSGFVDLRRGGIEDISTHDHRACPGYVNEHEDHGVTLLHGSGRNPVESDTCGD
jgi:hypothetical protein